MFIYIFRDSIYCRNRVNILILPKDKRDKTLDTRYIELKPCIQSPQYQFHLLLGRLHDMLSRDHGVDTSNTRTPIKAINIKSPRDTYSIEESGYSRPYCLPLMFASLFSRIVSTDDFLVTDPMQRILVANTNDSPAIILPRKNIG